MFSDLTVTENLAGLIGLYFVAAGGGLLLERKTIPAIVEGLSDNPALAYLAGVLTFVIGGAMVSIHNEWHSILSAFVSAVGWITLAEGLLMLAFRERFIRAFSGMAKLDRLILVFGAGTVILGLVLLFQVFSG